MCLPSGQRREERGLHTKITKGKRAMGFVVRVWLLLGVIYEVFRSTFVAVTVLVHSDEKAGTHTDLNLVPTSRTS